MIALPGLSLAGLIRHHDARADAAGDKVKITVSALARELFLPVERAFAQIHSANQRQLLFRALYARLRQIHSEQGKTK
jgi:hypothetical protein